MVTEVELEVCQLKVTLCPEVIDVGFAENVRVGTFDVLELVAQEEKPHMARRSVPHEIQRRYCFVIVSVLPPDLQGARNLMPACGPAVVGRMNRQFEDGHCWAENGRRA
jgi:hypothetical protein